MMFRRNAGFSQTPVNLAAPPGCAVAVQLAAAGHGRPQLALARYLDSTAATSQRLDAMAREIGLRRKRLQVLLSGDEYQFIQIEAPAVPFDELRTAVRWQVKEMLRHPIDAVTLDVLPPPNTSGLRPSTFVAAAANDVLRERMLQFRAFDSAVSVIDVPELAQRNLADCLEESGRATAVFSVGPEGALLTASRAGELHFTRRFELSTLTLAASPLARREQFDRLVLELQRTVDVLEHQYSFLSVSTLWLAPFAYADELLSLLIENLYLPVKYIALEQIFDTRRCPLPTDLDHQAALFHLLGMALRRMEGGT